MSYVVGRAGRFGTCLSLAGVARRYRAGLGRRCRTGLADCVEHLASDAALTGRWDDGNRVELVARRCADISACLTPLQRRSGGEGISRLARRCHRHRTRHRGLVLAPRALNVLSPALTGQDIQSVVRGEASTTE
jgi:hypothetical protein